MASDEKFFYNNLGAINLPFADILARAEYFTPPPDSWSVVVTDIRGSTAAFYAGQYAAVNVAAAGSVIIALNLGRRHRVDLPFVYGGDGATLLVPGELLDELLRELKILQANVARHFKLNLRVGALPIWEIRQAGHQLRVCRAHIAPGYDQAIFLDDGLGYAEHTIKNDPNFQAQKLVESAPLSLDGLRCRWDDVRPPQGRSEIMCLIVSATHSDQHSLVYRKVLAKLEEIFGSLVERHPLSRRHRDYRLRWRRLALESYARFNRLRPLFMINQWLGDRSLDANQLVAMADVLKVDGSLKTVVSGTREQREKMLAWLAAHEKSGSLIFGSWTGPASLVTCYVHPGKKEVINFVDGAEGGYIHAAEVLKSKSPLL